MKDENLENIMKKTREKISVYEFRNEKYIKPKTNILKMIASIILVILLSAGGVYAGTITYTKIWKQPKEYKLEKEVSEEEKKKCISEEEAEKIGNEYLKKIGFTEDVIKSLSLNKEYFSNENIWELYSEKASITIDGEKGVIKNVHIPTWEYKIPYDYGITRQEARVVARELLEKYRPQDDTGEYELIKLTRNMNTDEASYIWYATFQKKYGELLNPFEEIHIGWVPTINGLYTLSIKMDKYEENEKIVTEEEAIKIATEKDKQIEKNKQIKSAKTGIRIKQMNENVYLRENFKEEYESGRFNLEKTGENSYKIKEDAKFYKTDERVRRVWVIVIEYDVVENTLPNFAYYIDCTTGEIIGGEKGNVLTSEEQIYNDPYNLIEK